MMIRNYFKIAWRNMVKNKIYAIINITGLSVGMAVAVLIGLWVWDELSFDKYHPNFDRIAQVEQSQTFDGIIKTGPAMPLPIESEIRKNYSADFKYISMASWTFNHILAYGDKKISQPGTFMQQGAPEMLSVKMLKGTFGNLNDPSTILLSESVARALFGDTDPLDQVIKLDNKSPLKVNGVYEDLPYNTSFQKTKFLVPWNLYITTEPWIKRARNDWFNNSFQMFVQIGDKADMDRLSVKIKDAKIRNIPKDDARFNPQLFLHPMSRWHLYSDFKNGISEGKRMQYVYMFAAIGIFVLLLACINFMNLSTARSEKRAKEVGILKSIGSKRSQLISQFFAESVMITFIAFVISLLLVWLCIPYFNTIANKQICIPWTNPVFIISCLLFTLVTGCIAGSYPALYLSSFKPVAVLKGTFRAGRFSAVPRQVLVVVQFTVSVILIIGTLIVFKQIQFTKNRPVGYNRDGLVMIDMATSDLHDHFEAFKNDLISSGAVMHVAESGSPVTDLNSNSSGLNWPGKDPNSTDDFGTVGITLDYGKTVGWQFTGGRDFSKDFKTDTGSLVINEAAARYMNLKNPVGQSITFGRRPLRIIGVIKDMIMQSPYEPAKQTVFFLDTDIGGVINLRINPGMNMSKALSVIEDIHRRYSPEPFAYKFADTQYANKFDAENRIGQLSSFFTLVAIVISCLGLFGMASFMAEKRTKEIGIRKVLGATVLTLWGLLSRDFVKLVLISLIVAMPCAYYFMHSWLQSYQYRTEPGLWLFAASGLGAVTITLLTVSYQSIKAALANPVKSLKVE